MKPTTKQSDTKADSPPPQFDDVLKRMLSSPPQHKVKPKPAAKPAGKKPAE